jgi:hypothetical protein
MEIYYSVEGYLIHKYFKENKIDKIDEFNQGFENECKKYIKVKKRIGYSICFWTMFTAFAIININKQIYFHPIVKIFILFSLFAPNIWFYKMKYRNNRLDCHKLFIYHYVKNELTFTEKKSIPINNDNIISKKESTLFDENENEIEKFIQDYCNLITKGEFCNLKI